MPAAALSSFADLLAFEVRSTRADLPERVRACVRAALQQPDFVADCIACSLDTVGDPVTWANPPLVVDDVASVAVRLIAWPPGLASPVHEHRDWTVTGVIAGELTVRVHYPAHPGTVERTFVGTRGSVGTAAPPVIHQVVNLAAGPALSLHVFSGEAAPEAAATRGRVHTWAAAVPGPPLGPLARALPAYAVALVDLPGARAGELLVRLTGLGDRRTRLEVAKQIVDREPVLAGTQLLALAAECGPADRARLEAIGVRLRDG